MNASELHRKLLFCGYDDLAAYFRDNTANRYIHKQLLGVCTKNKINVPILTLFNEIYYLCLKIQCDRRPGEDINQRYIIEEDRWLGSHDAAMLVLGMVWALIQTRRKPTFNDECFLMQFTPYIKMNPHIVPSNDVLSYMRKNDLHIPPSYLTMPTPIDCIPKSVYTTNDNPWRIITENLSAGAIEWFITLYELQPHQLNVYERIYAAYTAEERKDESAYLRQLRVDIESGSLLPGGRYYKMIHPEYNDKQLSDDELDYKFSMGLARAMEVELNKDESKEDIITERDEAVRKCEELRKSHELDVARLEAEISDLKQQLERKPKAKADKEENKANPADNTIPITVEDMVAFVKREFSETSAVEFSLMLYKLAEAKNFHSKDFSALVNGIRDAIKQRDALQQTFNFNESVSQLNVSNQVENKFTEQ